MTNNVGSAKKQVDLANAEWAHIAPGKVVVATNEKAWLYQPLSKDDPFAQSMTGYGGFATTRKLLDTAIAAAKQAVKSDRRPPALTSTRWVWRLAGFYHLTHLPPNLMRNAAESFASNSRFDIEAWALEKAEEETGHDLLALLDIQSLGYDAEAVVKALKPPAAIALVDYLTRSTQDDDPIDCVGYSYTIERLSLGIGEDYIQKVDQLIPSSINATRCLRVHSSVGADADHVDENVSMITRLTPSERSRVARACYETALMCFSPPPGDYISDEELLRILKPLTID